jgi:predicted nuclease of restriction endonuclease-like (RecB) superfamily
MKFPELIDRIQSTHTRLQQQAIRAVNTALTLRNWLIGCYIVEFEQHGEDRAEYGAKLLQNISRQLSIRGLAETNLKLCRQFYQTYPDFAFVLNTNPNEAGLKQISQLITDQFKEVAAKGAEIRQLLTDESKKNEMSADKLIYLSRIFHSISFTHFVELIKIENPVKRQFFELLIMKTQASVVEVKRSIETLTYERTALSADAAKAFRQIENELCPQDAHQIVKSHYFFEFLNIQSAHVIEESELEQALIDHLQQFILELGYGFCFEARQKRILIDDDYYFVDLVFYHRVLKCHVLIELKVDKFKHEYLSQLNSYVAYFNDREKLAEDNPTIGILLCAEKGHQMVEYAKAGMTQQLFVSKYQLQLPPKEQLLQFIENELKHLNHE